MWFVPLAHLVPKQKGLLLVKRATLTKKGFKLLPSGYTHPHYGVIVGGLFTGFI